MDSTGLTLAARIAGTRPPTRPIATPTTVDHKTTPGVSLKSNTIADQATWFSIENLANDRNDAAAIPTAAPMTASATASITNDNSTGPPRKPSAIIVPISRVRLATAVFI